MLKRNQGPFTWKWLLILIIINKYLRNNGKAYYPLDTQS